MNVGLSITANPNKNINVFCCLLFIKVTEDFLKVKEIVYNRIQSNNKIQNNITNKSKHISLYHIK